MGISPLDCDHFGNQLYICGGSGVGFRDGESWSQHYSVMVCQRCGQFHAFKEENGQMLHLEFTLVGEEVLRAAGQYDRWITEGELEDDGE